MTLVIEWLSTGCVLTLSAAVAAMPLALIVFAFDVTIGRRMAARYRCLLWSLVAIRLLMPVAPESPLSLQNVWQLVASQSEPPHVRPTESLQPWISAAPQSAAPGQGVVFQYNWAMRPAAEASADAFDPAAFLLAAVSLLWSVGAIFVVLRALIASIRFSRRLRAVPYIEDSVVNNLLREACHQIGLRRPPQVKYVPELSVPALFGVFRPTLCLPDQKRAPLDDSQLRMIMLHELMHVRRGDGYLSWLITFVQAMHWFNPLAWLTIRRIEAYREQACDDAVRRFTKPQERHDYTDLLLRFAAGSTTGTLNLVGLSFVRPTRLLASRIVAFGNPVEAPGRISRLLIGSLVVVVAVAGLTDAASSTVGSTHPESASAQRSRDSVISRQIGWMPGRAVDKNDDFLEERSYDLSPALEKLAQANPSDDARRRLLTYLKLPSLKPQSIRKVDGDPEQLRLVMTRREHAIFAEILAGISRSGPWQVAIDVKVLRPHDVEAIGDVDWEAALKFASPTTKSSPRWPEQPATDMAPQGAGLSVSIESLSWEYSPYLALVIDEPQMSRMVDRLQRDTRSNLLSRPKVTVFNGERIYFSDEAQMPFVTGVQFVKGAQATAAQPEIAVLPEGARLDVQPNVIDAGALDLRCQLTLSFIDGVRETKLPGREIVVQNPRASRKTISARCQLAPGQTLLLAPFVGTNNGADTMFFVYAITARWFPDHFASSDDGNGTGFRTTF